MAQGRVYNIVANNGTIVSGGQFILATLWTAASIGTAGSVIQIHRVEISQIGSTTSTMIYGCLSTSTGTSATMTSVTPTPVVRASVATPVSGIAGGTTAAAATCGVFPTLCTLAGEVQTYDFGFNILNGYLWVPTPPEVIVVQNNMWFNVRFLGTPGLTNGWNISLDYEELI